MFYRFRAENIVILFAGFYFNNGPCWTAVIDPSGSTRIEFRMEKAVLDSNSFIVKNIFGNCCRISVIKL